jgi:hypothetical protein
MPTRWSRGGGVTLTMVQGGAPPMIILDYRRDVGGLPVFDVSAVSGTPRLQAIYSEAKQWLYPTGDGSYPDGAEVNVSYAGRLRCGQLVARQRLLSKWSRPDRRPANSRWRTIPGPNPDHLR